METMQVKLSCWFLFFLISGALFGQISSEEEKIPSVSTVFFINNAQIKTAPDNELFTGSVLIEDGLIVEVGKKVSRPSNAIEIKGDSLFIYAGFISGLSHAGYPKKKVDRNRDRKEKVDPGNPGNELAGITPAKTLLDQFSSSDPQIESLRSQGFTAAHVVPRKGMMPGQGAFILLSGDKKEDYLLTKSQSLFAQFKGARGVYPSTIIGVIAKWKELYKQAEIAQKHESSYKKNPNGLQRPQFEPAVKALYPVINLQTPVVFNTAKVLSIHRAIQLQKELGFSLILGNVKQGWPVIEDLKERNIPLFLSLDLPKDEKKKKRKKGNEAKGKKEKEGKEKIDKKETEKPKTEEQKQFENRKLFALSEYQKQAATFEKAGLDFGFSTIDTKSKDLKENINTLIEAGLSQNQALASLTTYPALIFGLSESLGTIEKGKIANLVISDRPIFSSEASIRYVFVDGEKYEYEKKKAKAEKE
jgi:imidazolonepropionase-like amidohydrolase